MGMVELIQQKAFLGKEFMTWLWFRAETDPVFDLPGPRQVEVENLGGLVLDANYGDARSTTLKGEAAGVAPEAGTALREGKKIKRAQFKFSTDGMDWTATLDGESFALTGLRIPNSGKLPFNEMLRLRLEYVNEYESILGDLMTAFLDLRLDAPRWAEELDRIHAWVADK